MLLVREVRALAGNLQKEDFLRQVGPFVLVRRPPDPVMERLALRLGAHRTRVARSPASAKMLMAELLQHLDDLGVATLPPIQGSDELHIGRLPDNDLVVDDPSVSKRHAVLRWDALAHRCMLTDMGSRNGTLINAEYIRDANALVSDGDMLSFGDTEFCFLETLSLLSMLQTAHYA
ncbi:FHA domain-containing protein [Stigmatella aurantiaca]|uniref:FHA domain protein n=1 Tax=Stigmatella aurantiaca (strain DW4/3-1) TaxID=378806 RepID=Q08WF4_STIAD|nr:FHA domain-containing protein [Stigmatella aurantiaca]ADO71729.1 FHA domain protein [Stigmatella aurantiaca DW4/3-1]EAU64817.1 kinase associated protein phosphatase [Stigmatella aurantiaca DW4/3-1]